MLLNRGFTSQAVVFRFKKQPEKEKEHQKSSTANQQDWGGRLGGFDQCRVGTDRYDLEETEVWIAAPQDEDWEEAPDEEDGDDDSPCEEPLPRFRGHCGEDLGVDYGVVEAVHNFEDTQTDNNQHRFYDPS